MEKWWPERKDLTIFFGTNKIANPIIECWIACLNARI